jgi:hypothetical protein
MNNMCVGCGFSGCGGMCGCDDWDTIVTKDVTFTCVCGNIWTVVDLECEAYGRGRSGTWYATAECTKCGEVVDVEGEVGE